MEMKKKDAGSGKGGKNMEKKMAMMRKVLSCLVIINLLIAVSMGSIQAQNISNTVENLYFEVETIVNLKEDGSAHIFETISSEQQNIANINTDSIKSQALYNLEKQGYSVSNFDCDVKNSDQRITIKASYDIQNYATDRNGIWSVKPSTTDIYNVIGSYGYYLDIPFDLNIQSKMKFVLPERSNVIYSGPSTINKNFGRSDVSLSRKVTTEGGREVILTEGDSRFIKGDIIDLNKFVELAKLIEFRYEIVQTVSNESYIKNINYKKDLSANDFNYQSNNTTQLNVTTYAIQTLTQASESSTLSNDKIKLILYDDGNFRMERADGADLLFPSDTSAITIRIDSTDYAHNGGQYLGNYISTPLTITDQSHAMIGYSFLDGDLDLRLDYFLAEGTIKFKADVTNNGGQSHDVKVRFLFDTQLGPNDGAPLYSSVTGVRTFETEIDQQVPLWRAYDQWPDETVTGVGTIATSYDRLVFAWWPSAIQSTYDYTPDPNQRFYTPGYTTSPNSDSCVLLYWDMGLISPGESVDAMTYYGTEEASFSNDIELLISKTETLKDELSNEINNDGARYDGVSCLADMTWKALDATDISALDWIKLGGDIIMAVGGTAHLLQQLQSAGVGGYGSYVNLLAEEGAWFTGLGSITIGAGDLAISHYIHDNIDATFNAHGYDKEEFHDNVVGVLKGEYTQNDQTINQVFSTMDSRQSEFENYARSNIPPADQFDYPQAINLIDLQISKIRNTRALDGTDFLEVAGSSCSYKLGAMRANEHQLSEFANSIRNHNNVDTVLWFIAGGLFVVGCVVTGGTLAVVCIAAAVVSGVRIANSLEGASDKANLAAIWHSSFGELVSMKRSYPYALDNNLDWLTDQIIDWKFDQIDGEVTYFSMPSEIVLGENEDYGTATATITVKNTGSLPCEVSALTPIFRGRLGSDWLDFLLLFYTTIPYPQEPYEQYILDSGHEQTISFEFPLPRNTMDGTPYTTYTMIDLDEKRIALKVTDIFVGTQEEIDQMRSNTQTTIDTYISTGQSTSEDVSISDSTEIAQFIATYPGSDMDLHVYDTAGNHVGMNYDTGYVELEIAGAHYSGAGERPEWIVIPDAGGNSYTVEIVGVDVTIPEPVIVRTTEIPQRPAIMAVSPKNIVMTLEEELANRLAIVVKESGGQNDLNDVTVSVDGEVAPWIEFSFTDIGDITAGDSVIVGATVNIPSNAVAGEYTGIIHVTGVDSSTGEELRDDVTITLSVRGPSGQKTIYVDDDFTDDPANHKWNTIQEGINDASPEDTIIVGDGIYNENIDVNKPHLTIMSENGAENCIVQATNLKDHVVYVTADHVNIRGFTVRGASVYLADVDYCNISNNIASNNNYGIYLYKSNSNLISNNIASNNDASGICLDTSSNSNIISNNIASNNNDYGIYLYGSNSNLISNNIASSNKEKGITLVDSNNNEIYLNNFVNNAKNVNSYRSLNAWNSAEKITYTYNEETYENYLGNYWDDYMGPDANRDGIGDIPYSINSDMDNYPLMQPWENYFGAYEPGSKITITSDKEGYPPGDYVFIRMEFKNEGEEPVLIANPITTTFIAEDGSIVLEEDLSYSISVTLGAGGQWSFGTSYKLPDDAPEGCYDVKVSISGGNYVKTIEDLFFVKAESQIPSGGGIGISIKPKDVETTPGSTITYDITVYNYYSNTESFYISVDPGSCDYDWFGWHTKSISIPGRGQGQVPLSVTPTEVGNFKFEVKANVESNPSIYASQEGNINVVAAGGMDTTPPDVTNVMVSPSIASPGSTINVSANVFDSSGIRWVRAFISKGGEHVVTVFMSDPDEDGIYTGTWSTVIFTESGIYNIDISATDTEGNEALAKGPEVEIA